ncbi:MAG: hypothetical protein IPK59_12890 [Rhodospirillaceae bacterium]|nr:hypothetical protein [Rhodospirillaceae bacterium]
MTGSDASLLLQPDPAIMGKPVPTLVNAVKKQGLALVAELPDPALRLE